VLLFKNTIKDVSNGFPPIFVENQDSIVLFVAVVGTGNMNKSLIRSMIQAHMMYSIP
jgi:hypothetical protein